VIAQVVPAPPVVVTALALDHPTQAPGNFDCRALFIFQIPSRSLYFSQDQAKSSRLMTLGSFINSLMSIEFIKHSWSIGPGVLVLWSAFLFDLRRQACQCCSGGTIR
jgi:hypothetical protein